MARPNSRVSTCTMKARPFPHLHSRPPWPGAGIGTCPGRPRGYEHSHREGCRGFTGPVPPPLLMSDVQLSITCPPGGRPAAPGRDRAAENPARAVCHTAKSVSHLKHCTLSSRDFEMASHDVRNAVSAVGLPEHALHVLAGLMDAGFGRADRDAELLGHLRVVELADVPQHQRLGELRLLRLERLHRVEQVE